MNTTKTIRPTTMRSLPSKMQNFLYYLVQLPGVQEVRRCDSIRRRNRVSKSCPPRGRYHFQSETPHYESASRTLSVKAKSGPYITFFNIKIDPSQRESIESAVEEYTS